MAVAVAVTVAVAVVVSQVRTVDAHVSVRCGAVRATAYTSANLRAGGCATTKREKLSTIRSGGESPSSCSCLSFLCAAQHNTLAKFKPTCHKTGGVQHTTCNVKRATHTQHTACEHATCGGATDNRTQQITRNIQHAACKMQQVPCPRTT